MGDLSERAVEAALREWMAHVDYDTLKYLEGMEDGVDRFPVLTQDFIRYYENAGRLVKHAGDNERA